MSLQDFAKSELERAGFFAPDSDYEGEVGKAVMALIDVFSEQGHSGGSAPITAQLFATLAKWQPIMPLTGEADEWFEYAEGLFQNKRCGSVFKSGVEGQAYNNEGRIFQRPNGSRYTDRLSRVNVTFPYVPTSEIVPAPAEPDDTHTS